MAERPFRLGHLDGNQWVAYRHPETFELSGRLVAGVPGSDPRLFKAMLALLQGPVRLLYVLHTPRGEAAPGRYESPALSLEEATHFIERFADFLAADGRFDLWAHSATDRATVVWDRHDQLFCYGPVDRFASRLRELGFSAGNVDIPAPHRHHYHKDMDTLAAGVMCAFEWHHSPLKPEDEQ